MTSRFQRIGLWVCAATALLASTLNAHAQKTDYPNKPIRMVVTFPPGGSTDVVLRMLLPRLNDKLGQQVVVDNRPGAGGNIGLNLVAKAPADGYTLGIGAAGALSANASLYAQMPFDPVKDLKPVSMVAAIPFVLIGQPGLPAKNFSELMAYAKSHPGKLSIAHGGNGTAMHLSTALLNQMSDMKLVEIPYKGSGPAALDVLTGQVPLAIVDLPASLQHIKAGKLTAYAVTSLQRLSSLPDVPTLSESGLSGYDSTGWFGMVAPAGTPSAIVTRMNAEMSAALNDEAIKTSMRNLGVEPAPSSVEGFEAYIKSESQKWAKVIKTANIKIE
jgi:tripartite-type tricarboxylate transporter receptor subunit TctC